MTGKTAEISDPSLRGRSAGNIPLGAICLAVLCVILTLGLWPFHSPANEVEWLRDTDGLGFGRFGTVLSGESFQTAGSRDEASGSSIEIWGQPRKDSDSATLLSFYARHNPNQFQLSQSLTDLRLKVEVENGASAPSEASLYVDDVFSSGRRPFITITSGYKGTKIYIDGAVVSTAPHLRIPQRAFEGRLLLGDSPRQPDSWQGTIKGLAIYNAELDALRVRQHYDTWLRNRQPDVTESDRSVALYLLNEHQGRVIHNKVKPGTDLTIPERYVVEDKSFIEPVWREFSMSSSYWLAVCKNIVGFIPIGVCFYPYLSIKKIKPAAALTVVLGAIISITIETVQAFLPTRDSGMSDIFTNTLGTWSGILLCRAFGSSLVKRIPWSIS